MSRDLNDSQKPVSCVSSAERHLSPNENAMMADTFSIPGLRLGIACSADCAVSRMSPRRAVESRGLGWTAVNETERRNRL